MSSKNLPSSNSSSLSRPVVCAVTGGIGSGKSYVCRILEEKGFPVFYCDDEAKRIIREDAEVHRLLTALVGEGVYDAAGRLVKARLADYICRSTEHAGRVDAIVHPRVGEAFLRWTSRRSEKMVFMECALLFEAGFDRYADFSLLVSAPLEQRIAQVMQRDGVAREKALSWISLQMSEDEKARRATHIIYNDYTPVLSARVEAFLAEVGRG